MFDLEAALLIEGGIVTDKTVIVGDFIIMPDEAIKCQPSWRPSGVVWEDLGAEKVSAIPVFAARAAARRGQAVAGCYSALQVWTGSAGPQCDGTT